MSGLGTPVVVSSLRMQERFLLYRIVPRSFSARTGTMSWWSGCITVFWVVRNSIIRILYVPHSGLSCKVMSGNLTTLLARSSVTEYFLKKDIPIKNVAYGGENHERLLENFTPDEKTKQFLLPNRDNAPVCNLDFEIRCWVLF